MTTGTTRVRSWYRPMRARRPDEAHRVATPLELFFDLCFVVAVAQAVRQPAPRPGARTTSGTRSSAT